MIHLCLRLSDRSHMNFVLHHSESYGFTSVFIILNAYYESYSADDSAYYAYYYAYNGLYYAAYDHAYYVILYDYGQYCHYCH